jgi:multidrug efflux pump subunit AcrB
MRTRGRVDTPEQFGDLVIREVNGHPVKVADVGRVDDGVAEATTLANIGDATVLMAVGASNRHQHRGGRQQRQKDASRTCRGDAPGYTLRIVLNQADFSSRRRSAASEEHLVRRLAQAAVVVQVLLGNLHRSTIIDAISNPHVEHRPPRAGLGTWASRSTC